MLQAGGSGEPDGPLVPLLPSTFPADPLHVKAECAEVRTECSEYSLPQFC